ncbi:MICOS complex subunit MIC25 isoform X3 [Heterocephalus glaber]|uniref:MICOS complex subunit MIC25 isoform X3 n=2 Tax=Heterocephalus glaber TaxID=10181 RepID=A0AAX6SAZ5_HETGA|nr:MICOS complex subunit MIC25 isoform X3 [Heterocephalus glaber]
MGTIESSEGRRVSFGMDEEERVRVLQGIRLSENVVQRMKDPSPLAEGQQPAPPPAAPDCGSTAPQKEPKLPTSKIGGGRQPSGVKEDLKRFRQEQATVQDELFRVVRREREAAAKHVTAVPPAVEGSTDQEKQQSARLARELESREAELRHHDTFYQEQLGCIERKNVEMYKLSSQQFHEAASKAENTIKQPSVPGLSYLNLRPRRVEPVCSGLQAQILRCYRDHVQEVLLCSDLVKAYQHCVSATHKGPAPARGIRVPRLPAFGVGLRSSHHTWPWAPACSSDPGTGHGTTGTDPG